MGKKDYIKFAMMIKKLKTDSAFDTCSFGRCLMIVAGLMAGILQADNSKFDRERFMKACGF